MAVPDFLVFFGGANVGAQTWWEDWIFDAAGRQFPGIETRAFFVHSASYWAVYEATPAELEAANGDAYQAFSATHTVPRLAEDLTHDAAEGLDWCQAQVAAGRVGVACGASNGVVVAFAAAMANPAAFRGLVAFSGVPAASQEAEVRGGAALPPAVFTAGSWERYFGGPVGVTAIATGLGAVIVPFEGSHCREPWDGMVAAFAALA